MTQSQDDSFCDLLPRLHRRASRLSRTAEEAEDLAQETALRLWQTLSGNHVIKRPDRYAMIMLHNLARQRWRQRRPSEALSEDMALTGPAAPARLACAELRAAISRLPKDQVHVMAWVLAGESSPKTIAEQMGLRPGTVMSRLARARATLRRELEVQGSVTELL